MKILKKALLSLSIILLNTTNVYATTTGTYVPESNSGVGKFFLFLVAIGLVALVLFIGYKMDKNEAQEKRKEKIIKQRDNDINDMYSKIYSSHENNKKDIFEDEIEEELPKVNFKPETEEYFKDINKEETQKINLINEEEIDDCTAIEENVETKIEEEIFDESYTESDSYDEKEKQENNNLGETQIISFEEDAENDDEEFDSTMVFDVGPLKDIDVNMNVEEKIINKISDVKGYDYEDNDLELLDLEQTIAEANIKKYTRDKNQEMIKVKRQTTNKKATKKETKDTKKYTRKKAEKEPNKKDDVKEEKKTTKKYKAKKVVSKKEENNDEKEVTSKVKKYTKVSSKKEKSEEEKTKKERKATAKEEVVEKPKRGRKPKTKEETVEKPKRGRKPKVKEETVEKPKRGRKPSAKK